MEIICNKMYLFHTLSFRIRYGLTIPSQLHLIMPRIHFTSASVTEFYTHYLSLSLPIVLPSPPILPSSILSLQ